MEEQQQKFKVEARCSVLLRSKVAVVVANDKDEAISKAKAHFGVDVTIMKVEEYHGPENDC